MAWKTGSKTPKSLLRKLIKNAKTGETNSLQIHLSITALLFKETNCRNDKWLDALHFSSYKKFRNCKILMFEKYIPKLYPWAFFKFLFL